IQIDGKELPNTSPAITLDAREGVQTVHINLERSGLLRPGAPNQIEVRVANGNRTVVSRGSKYIYAPPLVEQRAPIQIHALVVGVSDYLGEARDLRYAAKDARDFAHAFGLA